MNVSELARRLRVNPKRLREILPEFGFDIGAKAIKIDDRVAQQVIRQWRKIKKELDQRTLQERDKKKEEEKIARKEAGARVMLPSVLTVKEFAERLKLPVARVIVELMKNGILVSQNERIDRESAAIIAEEMGFVVELEDEGKAAEVQKDEALAAALDDEDGQTRRAPVIVVMGHVDHGKTRLLDAIRRTNVMEGESGGITQHIGAYQVKWHAKDGENRDITFIDTPGHEAFTVMRSRGAKVADIAILVVAADDGVKPQTLEVIDIIKAAKMPYIVAINKIDKEGANPDRVRTELSQRGVQPEEWGGSVPMVEISAKEDINIDKLLDVVLLVGDLNEEAIVANPDRPAAGTIVESHVDRGEGPVATALVQTGTLRVGDPLVVNTEVYGKVRAMKNFLGEDVKEAPPSTPVKILGFKVEPDVGDILDVSTEGAAQKIDVRKKRMERKGAQQTAVVSKEEEDDGEDLLLLKVIVRADVLGSLEAILSELEKLSYEGVSVKVVAKGLGNVSDDDARKATALDARLIGFHVGLTPVAESLTRDENIPFHRFEVIYDLLNFVKEEMESLLGIEEIEHEAGLAKVIKVFRTEKKKQTLGIQVEDGTIVPDLFIRVKIAGECLGKGTVKTLQLGKGPAKSIPAGSQGGLGFVGDVVAQESDTLEFYTIEKKKRKLDS